MPVVSDEDLVQWRRGRNRGVNHESQTPRRKEHPGWSLAGRRGVWATGPEGGLGSGLRATFMSAAVSGSLKILK